jgi:ATP-binding cassette, subfamily B, multidrug efflux pump
VRLFPYLGSLRPYLARYRGEIVKGYLCILVQSGASLTVPWILRRGINKIQAGAEPSIMMWVGVWILGLSLVSGIFLFLKRWILIGASRLVEYDLRRDYFDHLLKLSLSFYQRNRTGDLMARATNDLNAVRDVVGPGLMYGLTTITVTTASMVLMLRLDPVLALATLIPFPLMAVVVSRFAQEVHRRSLRVQNQYGILSNAAQENVAGIRVVQSFAQEEPEKAHFAEQNRAYLTANLSLIRYRSLFFASIAFVLGGGALILLWAGGARVIAGKVTLGDLVAFMMYLSQLTWPFIAVGWVIAMIQRGEAAMQRLLQIWQEIPEIRDGPVHLPDRPRGEITLERVTFSYPGGEPVLNQVDLHIPAGTSLAVVGRTGSGKTSLINLISRLYDPQEGRVLVDGHDLRELSLSDLREALGVVPQDPFLFSESIEANIRFGREDATEEEVIRATNRAGLDPDLATLQKGLRTRVGERGVALSGGQRQRAALARALLKDPSILILDDALSSVDKSTEEALLQTLRQVAAERTVLLIAHRISTVRDADQIVVLDGGRITERGTHDELLQLGGLYADMARRQALAEELENLDVPA